MAGLSYDFPIHSFGSNLSGKGRSCHYYAASLDFNLAIIESSGGSSKISLLKPSKSSIKLQFEGALTLLNITFQKGVFPLLFQMPATQIKEQIITTDLLPALKLLKQSISVPIPEIKIQMIAKWKLFIDSNIKHSGNSISPHLSKALNLIDEYSGDITVNAIAETLGISRRHLGRFFTKTMGISPKTYLRIYRFQKAWQQFQQDTSGKLSNIVYDNGYYDQSHFIHECKLLTGLCPKQFLKSPNQILNPIA